MTTLLCLVLMLLLMMLFTELYGVVELETENNVV